MTVSICIYSCLAGVLFLMLNFSLVLLDRQSVEPLAQSLFFVTCALLYYRGVSSAPDASTQDGLPGQAQS